MKKKILSLFCVFLLVFSFVSCSDGNSDGQNHNSAFGGINPNKNNSLNNFNNQTNNNTGTLYPHEGTSDESKSFPADITLESPERGRIHITSYSICSEPNFPDQKLIVLHFDFTNLYTRDTSPSIMTSFLNLYQDDVLLKETLWYEEETTTYIRPNANISASFTFCLRNSTSDVVIECKGYDELYGSATMPIA